MSGWNEWARRLRLGSAHLLMSAGVVGAVAFWMFFIWYPEPFRTLSGGLHLFGILVMVDLMLGPCATLVVASPGKPMRELKIDIAVIVLLQLGALSYGTWTVYQARPVYMAFEIDRFRTIQAVDVPVDLLPQAPVAFQILPKMGPKLVAVRPFKDGAERANATLAALQGLHLGARPDLWMSYDLALPNIREEAKSIDALLSKRPDQAGAINESIQRLTIPRAEMVYLPVAGRDEFWTVLIHARTGQLLAYLPIDPY